MSVNAKSILGWLKERLLVVVFVTLILLILPACFFVSAKWNKAILAKHEKTANDEFNRVKGASMVSFTAPPFDPKQSTFAFPSEPNRAVTKHFQQWKVKFGDQVDKLGKEGEDFNKGVGPAALAVGRGEHKPLVDGLFPKIFGPDAATPPSKDAVDAKVFAMEDALVGKRGVNPYQKMLDGIGAGPPADQSALAQTIRDVLERRKIEVTANNRAMTTEEATQLRELLVDQRLGAYQARASQISLYASMDIFAKPSSNENAIDPFAGSSGDGMTRGPVPATIALGSLASEQQTPARLFLYQWDMWVYSDIFSAVRLANLGPDGKQLSVDKSVVKRIKSVRVFEPEGMASLNPTPLGEGEVQPTARPGPASEVPGLVGLDKTASITGRVRFGGNPFFELRRAEITVVVASDKCNYFQTCIARTNFMSITGLNCKSVDIYGDLSEGYFYGDEHVIEATVQVETIWLKSWLLKLMPEQVQKALGMEVAAQAAPVSGGSSG